MIHQALEAQLGFTYFAIHANVGGVTQAESLQSPPGGGNGINWVVGHIVNTRNAMHALLASEPVLDETGAAIYGRHTAPLGPDSTCLEIDQLLAHLDASQEVLREKLASTDAEHLAAEVPDLFHPEEKSTRAETLATLLFHEAYHAGQLGTIRRTLGKDAAIK